MLNNLRNIASSLSERICTKTKHYTNKHGNAIIKILASVIIVSNLVCVVPARASLDYSSAIKSGKALNSPLVNSSTTREEFNPWEMEAFAVFLSNFTQPFVDSYVYAFTRGGKSGSKGAGADALEFAAGGDVEAEGELNAMLNWIMDKSTEATPIKVQFNLYNGNKRDNDKSQEIETRNAKLSDLFVETEWRLNSKDEVKKKYLDFANVIDSHTDSNKRGTEEDLADYPWVVRASSLYYANNAPNNNGLEGTMSRLDLGNRGVPTDVLIAANLPTFYIGKDDPQDNAQVTEGIVFSLTDGWDAQVFALVMSNTYKSKYDEYTESIENLLENMYDLDLVLDSFGNICVPDSDGFPIVVIPACMNQHITTGKRYNLLTSVVVSDYYNGSSENLALKISGTNFSGGYELASYAGASNASSVQGGKFAGDDNYTIIYNSIDSRYAKDIYSSGNIGSTNTDFTSSEGFKDLKSFLLSPIDTKHNIRVESTYGINTTNFSWWESFKSKIFGSGIKAKDKRADAISGDESKLRDRLIVGCYDSMYVLANAFGANSDETLDWIYSNSSSNPKTSILGEITYTTNVLPSNDDGVWMDDPSNNTMKVNMNMVNGENANTAMKGFLNHYLKFINSTSTRDLYSDNSVSDESSHLYIAADSERQQFNSTSTYDEMIQQVFEGDLTGGRAKHFSPLFIDYLVSSPNFGIRKDKTAKEVIKFLLDSDKLYAAGGNWLDEVNRYVKGFDTYGGAEIDKEQVYLSMASMSKVSTGNSALQAAGNYLNLSKGTLFAATATWAYLSYLDFYGIINNSDGESFFDEELFKKMTKDWMSSVDPDDVFEDSNLMSQEEKQQQVLNFTYLLLNPNSKEAREYRNNLISTGIQTWTYNEYNKICYGGGRVTDKYGKLISKDTTGKAGFLHIYSYDENFMTSWVIENYSRFVVMILIVFLLVTVIVGTVKGKKFGWYLMTIATIAFTFIVAPSTGEITPYICENMVQAMFSDNMQHWAVSEAIENYTTQEQYDEDDAGIEILNWISAMKITQLNKTLIVKKDISKKIVETISVNYSDIQQLQSARWMLPMLIRQIAADDGSQNYVQVSLTDIYQDLQDLYLYYNINEYYPGDHIATTTVDSNGDAKSWITEYGHQGKEYMDASDISNVYGGFRDLTYSIGNKNGFNLIPRSVSWAGYNDRQANTIHTYFYYMFMPDDFGEADSIKIGDISSKDSNGNSRLTDVEFEELALDFQKEVTENPKYGAAYKSRFQDFANRMIGNAANYNHQSSDDKLSTDGVKQEFGYLWSTETLFPYFYIGVRDTFGEQSDNLEVSEIMYQLQGLVTDIGKDGESNEIRQTLMHFSNTGYTRDFLDLENLLGNMLPYMYEMQIMACGTDNGDGILGDELLGEDYAIYKDTDKSWMFKCNWATKLIEASQYSRETKIGMYSGYNYKIENDRLVFTPMVNPETGTFAKDTVTITNSILPHNYFGDDDWLSRVDTSSGSGTITGYRPMVFSEAQMHQLCLTESDLSSAELACINVNREVSKKWTYLLNYANATGIQPEVLYEIMALEALLAFNKEFSPDNFISSAMALYPTSVDLRSINFDNVMKLIIMSNSMDSTYIYKDAVYAVIEEEGTVAGLLVLLVAWMCSVVIPWFRTLALGLIFYLSLASCFYNSLSDSRSRFKMTAGAFTTNLAFMLMTIAYYATFWLMVTVGGADDLLVVNRINIGTGFSIWKFLIIVIATIAYFVGVWKITWMVLKNYRDMGLSLWQEYTTKIVNGVNGAVSKVGEKISGNGGVSSSSSTSISDSSSKTSNSDNSTTVSTNNVTVKGEKGEFNITNDEKHPIPVHSVDGPREVVNVDLGKLDAKDGDAGYMATPSNVTVEVNNINIDKTIDAGSKKTKSE